MQPLFAYNALIWKNTITILTLILFVVFLVRGLYFFAVLGKHLLKSNQGFQYLQQARDTRNSFSEEEQLKNACRVDPRGEAKALGDLRVSLALVDNKRPQPPPLVAGGHPTSYLSVSSRVKSGVFAPSLALATPRRIRTPRSASSTGISSACRLQGWT